MAETKVAMVTGATRGIGRCGALDLASRGYDVVITGRTVHEGDAKEGGIVIPGSLDATADQIRVVVTDKDGNMTKIVEKPKTPISRRANIGLYYMRNWKLLFEGIDYVLQQPMNQGEYFLTDAFQYMIDKGAKIKVIDVQGWYDAGKIETMIETNEAATTPKTSRRIRRTAECASKAPAKDPPTKNAIASAECTASQQLPCPIL